MGSLPNISGLTGKKSLVVLSTQYAGQFWEPTTRGMMLTLTPHYGSSHDICTHICGMIIYISHDNLCINMSDTTPS